MFFTLTLHGKCHCRTVEQQKAKLVACGWHVVCREQIRLACSYLYGDWNRCTHTHRMGMQYNGSANACAVERELSTWNGAFDCITGHGDEARTICAPHTHTHTLARTTPYICMPEETISMEGKKITLKLIIEGKCLIKCSSTRLPFWNCIKKDSGCCWWCCHCRRCRCCGICCWWSFVWRRPICTAAEQCRYASVGRAKDLFADRNAKVTRTEITR